MKKIFDIPGFTYFAEKNKYTGSVDNVFNYKIITGDKLEIIVWKGKFCLDKTPENDIIDKAEFELTPDGLDAMKEWLRQKHDDFFKE
ncbi:MAG: hypothetical protein E7505_04075 [Ruminococcus sp.]|nr:hypothetical protein [Ruminococcus sp.]